MRFSIFLLFAIALMGCQSSDDKKSPLINLIPYPTNIEIDTTSLVAKSDIIFSDDAKYSIYELQQLDIAQFQKGKEYNVEFREDKTYNTEEYELEIKKNHIKITYSTDVGRQYALTTLSQLAIQNDYLPICKIRDQPKFKYRGMHLDVCRHFFSPIEVKRYLDFMAQYKFNNFHWHLTEDQGWRIEIKKYPKLQEVAAYRNETLIGHYNNQPQKFDGQKYGGYYTQEEVKDIVAYAKSLHINVIPEIEMPGHSLAALAAYPELGCTGGPYEVATKWGVFTDVYCPTEKTFEFLENVIDEVIQLFPGEYIHIGGDECPKYSWKQNDYCQQLIKKLDLKDEHGLQSYFIQRMEKYINSKGKKIIGWDEILEGGLAPNATVMSWRGNIGGIEAAEQKHNVIMTPGSHCYFDHYQSEHPEEPVAIGGFTPLAKVYSWSVIPQELDSAYHKYILGGQANVWTEYIKSFDHVEYMAFARGMAMSEALWGTNMDYEAFLPRYEAHQIRLKNKGINIANHLYDVNAIISQDSTRSLFASFNLDGDADIIVKRDGMVVERKKKNEKLLLKESGTYEVYAARSGQTTRSHFFQIDMHKATKSKITIRNSPSSKYMGSGNTCLINGILGSNEKYGGSEWVGFSGEDFIADLYWDNQIDIDSVKLRFFKGEGQWIYLPRQVEIEVSNDGQDFRSVAQLDMIESEGKICELAIPLHQKKVTAIKVTALNHGTIAEGNQGAGHKAWLFVDEVVVK